jgi:hypothetical protein
MSTPPSGTPPTDTQPSSSVQDRAKLERKILSQAHSLLTRQISAHNYPVAEATRIFDAIAELDRVSVKTLKRDSGFCDQARLGHPGYLLTI